MTPRTDWKALNLTAIVIPAEIGGAVVIVPCVEDVWEVEGVPLRGTRTYWNRFDPVLMCWTETPMTAMVHEVETALEAGVVHFIEDDLDDSRDPYATMRQSGVIR